MEYTQEGEVDQLSRIEGSSPAFEIMDEDIGPEDCVDGTGEVYAEHLWKPGDVECPRCGADLSSWNKD